jgi:hypothetical protein
VLGENLPQRRFLYHKPHVTWPRLEPGPPRATKYMFRPNWKCSGVQIRFSFRTRTPGFPLRRPGFESKRIRELVKAYKKLLWVLQRNKNLYCFLHTWWWLS